MIRPGSSTITWGIIGLWSGSVYFGDVEIFLDRAPHVGKEGPMRPDAGAIFVRLSDVVRADTNKSAIADLELAMQLDESFGLPTVLGAVASAAEDQNHRVLSLQF